MKPSASIKAVIMSAITAAALITSPQASAESNQPFSEEAIPESWSAPLPRNPSVTGRPSVRTPTSNRELSKPQAVLVLVASRSGTSDGTKTQIG